MADQEIKPDSLAKKAFIITMLGAILYIGVVFGFVIGGNQRDAANRPAEIVHSETFKP
jgi:hypothetical protein